LVGFFTINHSFDIFSLFQLASSTLDASAKIYAGRVDAIHSDAYKVLTGLGRSNVAMPKDIGMLSMIQLSCLLLV
jgi:Condensin complex subunit 2